MSDSRMRLSIMKEELDNQVVKLRSEVTTSDINKEIAINQINIDNEVAKQPGYMYFYSSMLANMVALREAIKVYVDFLEAVLDEEVRSRFASNPTLKITEDKVKAAITRSPELIEAQLELIKIKRDESLLKSVVDAFSHKKDMLITLASNMRSRAQSEINI